MAFSVSAKEPNGSVLTINLNRLPDTCPCCNKVGMPALLWAFHIKNTSEDSIHAVFQCPAHDCQRFFTAVYKRPEGDVLGGGTVVLMECYLSSYVRPISVSTTIEALSPTFVKVYKESATADDNQLSTICGPGYRKSLEFLVKDFLINHVYKDDSSKHDDIKKQQLGRCIQDHLDDKRLREISERAAWLGNDETHYVRKWEDKDLDDLKRLIHMVVNFIENQVDYDTYLKEMPKS